MKYHNKNALKLYHSNVEAIAINDLKDNRRRIH